MALRFLTASAIGTCVGGYFSTATAPSVVDCKTEYHVHGMGQSPDARGKYSHPDDKNALDIHEAQRAAEKLARDYNDHLGRVPNQGALTFKFKPYRLGEVINLTEETAIFRFLLPNETDEFVMEPCSTLQSMNKAGAMNVERVQRMYTPISPNGTKGYFDILVKKQKRGRMTEHLFSMKVGEALQFRVIQHRMRYLPNVYDNIGMIGTGSGITPLLQVIRAVCANPADKTKVQLLFANPSEGRVLLKGTLDRLAADSNGRFTPNYTVDKVSTNTWQGFIGLIDAAMVQRTMPPPAPKNILMVCGSDQLMNSLCGVPLYVMKPWSSGLAMQPAVSHSGANFADDVGGVLGSLGYRSEHVYRF